MNSPGVRTNGRFEIQIQIHIPFNPLGARTNGRFEIRPLRIDDSPMHRAVAAVASRTGMPVTPNVKKKGVDRNVSVWGGRNHMFLVSTRKYSGRKSALERREV